jgi:type II secretory pathway pseudopilin PulG
VIAVMLIGIIVSGVLGYFAGKRENQDSQKSHDITEIIKALDYFYANNNAYPIRQCSEDLNPIDFELTLERNLTGKVAKIGTTNYLNQPLPKDITGEYTSKYSDYIYNLPCPSLIQDTVNKNGNIYADGSEACNYNRSTLKTKNNPNAKIAFRCYLYTSSVNGDKYSVGYYSETLNKFVIVTKFRLDKAVLSYS